MSTIESISERDDGATTKLIKSLKVREIDKKTVKVKQFFSFF
jgi:hypothetical protein